MSLIKKFAGQTLIYGLGSVLSRIVYYLVVVVLLTYLLGENTTDFGVYGLYYAYASLLITLFSFRMDTALFRFGNRTAGKASVMGQQASLSEAFDTSMTAVIISAAGLVCIGVFGAQAVANLIEGYEAYPHYVRWFAFIIALDVLNLIPFAKLRLTDRATAFALYKIFNVALSVILILLFLVILPKTEFWQNLEPRDSIIEWVFIANLIASACLSLTLLPVLKGYKPKINTRLLMKMSWYVFPLVIVGMANAFIQFFSVQLQKTFLADDVIRNLGQAGVYDFTRRVAGLFVIFTTAFNYAAEPFFFNNSSESDRKELYGKICRLFVLVGGIAILGLYLGVDLIKYLGDVHFRGGLHLLPVLLMAYLFLGVYYNISIWYKLSDKTSYGAMISLIGVVITLVISVIYLPKIGIAASAWATLITYSTMVIIGYFLGQKHFPIAYPISKILRDMALITCIILLAYLIRKNFSIVLKYFCNALLMIVYLSYVWWSEKAEWKKIFKTA